MMLDDFKLDISNLGHAAEALLFAFVLMVIFSLFGIPYATGFRDGAIIMLAVYIGREKRDCETGLKLKAGSPKAWLLMWRRWKNVLDLAGPFIVFLISLGVSAR